MPLIELHRQQGVNCSAFITSWNPYGVDVGETTNLLRLSTLREESLPLANRVLDGFGKHPANSWPAEPSLLILGLSLEDAKELGCSHEQNAIVWIGAEGVPELILLRLKNAPGIIAKLGGDEPILNRVRLYLDCQPKLTHSHAYLNANFSLVLLYRVLDVAQNLISYK